jgi:nucleotide-binding universal stress UspA family protein
VRDKTLDLNYFLQKHVRNPALVRITRRVVLGRKSKQILEVVEKERVDLVVLPFQRKSFFHSLVARGKLSQRIEKFPCPVLLKPLTPSWA